MGREREHATSPGSWPSLPELLPTKVSYWLCPRTGTAGHDPGLNRKLYAVALHKFFLRLKARWKAAVLGPPVALLLVQPAFTSSAALAHAPAWALAESGRRLSGWPNHAALYVGEQTQTRLRGTLVSPICESPAPVVQKSGGRSDWRRVNDAQIGSRETPVPGLRCTIGMDRRLPRVTARQRCQHQPGVPCSAEQTHLTFIRLQGTT